MTEEFQESIEIQNAKPELSLGQIFRAKREFLKVEMVEICEFLRVKVRDIEAMESDDVSNVSSHIYVLGLIRSYAKFLKIDEKIIEEKIRNLSLKSNTDNKKHLLLNIGENLEITPDKNMFFNVMMISILLFLVALSLYNSFEDKSSLITNKSLILELEKNTDS